jgi:SAM-dependent methyltransferase
VHRNDFLDLTRDGYDRTARVYAERFDDYLDDKPVDRAMVHAFAGLVLMGANKGVVDVGCGTGVTTAMLTGCGVRAFGIDLSANMIGEARRLRPGLEFRVGSMTDLDVGDASVGGVCAWYSIIHIPDEHLAGVLGELHRVLTPGGLILLAFQVGDEPLVLTDAFGESVHLTYRRRQPRIVEEHLVRAGFRLRAELVRQPADGGFESTPQAFLIAQKIVGAGPEVGGLAQ